jgi:hypothetical protein
MSITHRLEEDEIEEATVAQLPRGTCRTRSSCCWAVGRLIQELEQERFLRKRYPIAAGAANKGRNFVGDCYR